MLPARRYPHILCLTANEKDFSLSLEMTIWGKRHSRIVSLPHWGRGTASAVDRVLSQTAYLRRSLPALFHTARTLSGSLRSPPSPRGEGFVRREKRYPHIAALCFPHFGQRGIPIDSLFLLEILERESIGILHDLLHFRLCHLQLFIAETSDVDGIAENLQCGK